MTQTNYQIIFDEAELHKFIEFLPDTGPNEVFYLCLFGRHKYCEAFPNIHDAAQFARVVARKSELKEKIRRMETPLGSYTRNGIVGPQECLALYIGLNPRNLAKASKNLLVELAKHIAEGNLNFNPISMATTEVHRATDKKYYIDFDFDKTSFFDLVPKIEEILPKCCYHILQTRGGFHLIVNIATASELARGNVIPNDWYKQMTAIDACDVSGSNNLTPVPGCTQGGFVPKMIASA